MLTLLLIWLLLMAGLIVFAIGRPGQGGALTLGYFLSLSLTHVPGILAFVDPAAPVPGRDITSTGFKLTLLGMAMFIVGAVAARLMDRRRLASDAVFIEATPLSRSFETLGWGVFGFGVFSYFVALPLAGRIPSATSIIASFATLLIVGLWLQLYGAAISHNWRRTWMVMAVLPILPLATLTTGGFIGFGVSWALSVMAFLFVVTRRRLWFYLSAPVVVFLALSVFVTYMGQRVGIREVVWNEQANFSARVERVSTIFTEFEVIDLSRLSHLNALNDRLNQNQFVGAGVERSRMGAVELKYGATVSPLALVPRAFWPDKPEVGGGSDLVTLFTGIPLAVGTSFGTGQVLEFYMNFGVPGVIGGFLLYGFVLMRLDNGIMRALAAGDTRGLLIRSMVGLPMLQPTGNLLEIVVAIAAGYISALIILSPTMLRARTRMGAGFQSVIRSAGFRRATERS